MDLFCVEAVGQADGDVYCRDFFNINRNKKFVLCAFYTRPFSDLTLREVCGQWRQHSRLLADSDFALVEPILATRSVAQHTLISRVGDPDSIQYLGSVLTDHLMELCRLARKAGNTQVAPQCVCVTLWGLASHMGTKCKSP